MKKRDIVENEFRVRERQIKVRATDYEFALIKQRKNAAEKKTMQDYILDVAINGYVIKVNYDEIRQLAFEINKIGTNINQIAHRINSEDMVYRTEVEEIKDNVDIIWNMLRSKFHQLP